MITDQVLSFISSLCSDSTRLLMMFLSGRWKAKTFLGWVYMAQCLSSDTVPLQGFKAPLDSAPVHLQGHLFRGLWNVLLNPLTPAGSRQTCLLCLFPLFTRSALVFSPPFSRSFSLYPQFSLIHKPTLGLFFFHCHSKSLPLYL